MRGGHAVRLTIDDLKPVRQLLQHKRICIDPQYRGETARLAENRGVRMRYFAKQGLTIDELGEALWDAGFVAGDRPTCNDVLDFLEEFFAPTAPRTEAVISKMALDVAEGNARKRRWRLFDCPKCGQIARGSRATLIDCGLCREMTGETVPMIRRDPLPEEVLESALARMSA
jgi:hypothetical protein